MELEGRALCEKGSQPGLDWGWAGEHAFLVISGSEECLDVFGSWGGWNKGRGALLKEMGWRRRRCEPA